MTPRQRSILIGGSAPALALLGVFLGVRALVADDVTEALGEGQFIENQSLDETDVALSSSSSVVARLLGTIDTTSSSVPPSTISTTVSTVSTVASSSSTIAASITSTSISSATSSDPRSTTSQSTPTTTTDGSTSSTAPTSIMVASTTSSTTAPLGGLNSVELEIVRLTNELRADPSGPLARQKPMPSCVTESFYDITVNRNTGHPTLVPALTVNRAVSITMARAWSMVMDSTGNFAHRPNSEAAAIYSQLGISWSATGENIAWVQGYPDPQAAQVFFEGWRESDSGHYCALVAGTYTHVGVGYYKGAVKSWATQNFYRPA